MLRDQFTDSLKEAMKARDSRRYIDNPSDPDSH
jgi:uncharacterized protein YqeY